jgi:HEAT repeat protein
LSAVADVLLNGDERLRQAAAESLVYLPKQGPDIIREAAQVNDLLTRRAAVFGLLQIREPWSKQMLEKIAVEDGQWVVRNAAAQALDVLQERDPRIPRPLLLPHETPWLVSFAGKRNIGLSEYQTATNVLLMALKSGTFEDQMAALRYLKDMPEENVISAVYSIYYGDQPELKDAALLLIWQWTLAGVKLPSPSLFGVVLT